MAIIKKNCSFLDLRFFIIQARVSVLTFKKIVVRSGDVTFSYGFGLLILKKMVIKLNSHNLSQDG